MPQNNNIFFKIDNKEYANSNNILIKIQSVNQTNITVFSYFYDKMSFFPSTHIYSHQLVYLNDNEKFTFNFDSYFNNKYRFLINNTYGNGEICFDKNCLDKSTFSGRNILSFPFKNEVQSIDIYNKFPELLFMIKIDYEFEKKLLKELEFNYVYKEINDIFQIKYILKDKVYKGADINFYFYINNTKITKNDFIIKVI